MQDYTKGRNKAKHREKNKMSDWEIDEKRKKEGKRVKRYKEVNKRK